MSTPAQRTHARLIIDRLVAAHADSQQRVLGSDIFDEAANTIRALLADEEERYRRNVALKSKNEELQSKLDRIAEIARRAISGDEAGRGDAEGNYAQGQIDLGRAIQDALK